jgi:enoyl-[acyl-carrier protein] reductase/trans-2-enoyl-CoA reductase (NAD+)
MRRLFLEMVSDGKMPALDAARRIRMDDREMREDVQAEVLALWPQVTTENLPAISDYASFQRGFRNLFGFEVEGVDYALPVETDLRW